jgi:putative ABC transport system permease protein
MSKWLEDYTYRIDLGMWTFLSAWLMALVIALLTVSYHAIKAALIDPVKSIKYE